MLAVAALAVSCGGKDPDRPSPAGDTGIKVTLPSEGPLSIYKWCDYDGVRIGDAIVTLKDGKGSLAGTFEGTPTKDKFYTISYPSDITGVDSYLAYSFADQIQEENNSSAHLIPTVLIEDATSYEDITLSQAWATSKGGTFRTNGVVAFTLNLPADAGTLESIILESSGVDFPVNNSGTVTADNLTLGLSGISVSQPVKAYLSVSEKEVNVPAGALKVTVVGEKTYSTKLSQAVKMGGGVLTEITVLDASAWEGAKVLTGEGTEASPYILKSAEHMVQMQELVQEGKTVWFELGDDIDMSGVARWLPLNFTAPYDKAVHFDGKGHKISGFQCDAGSYPSLFGVLNGTVKNVVFDGAHIEGAGKAGVLAGYCGTNIGTNDAPQYIKADVSGVTVQNSVVVGDSYAGGLFGQVYSPSTITDCHARNCEISSTADRVGGLIGQLGVSNFSVGSIVLDCTAENVTLEAQKNVGGLIGVCYDVVSRCTASGHVTHTLESSSEVSLGGLIGHLENGEATDCSSSTEVELTVKGRSVGGFVGTFKSGKIERCFATGAVTGTYRNNGGFVGLIQSAAAAATIQNCYSTGKVTANSYSGGFVGLIDGKPNDAIITNCYSSGDVEADGFGIGGFIGFQSCPAVKVTGCVAWCDAVTAGAIGEANWSSAAFCGVTLPKSTITGCYRKPGMKVTAYWGTEEGYTYKLVDDFQHPNVSPSHPLTDYAGNEMTDQSTANNKEINPHYPQYPYHGKVESDKSLSNLVGPILGWSSSYWDLSGDMPKLKK